ncbi:MAG: isoleucine--tRNA ligase [Mycoplasma sp.]|nr:isoleucine--tRNA ligase [Mycoplasma sp.]
MEEKDYKSTLNMPQTSFSMRADLSIKEPQFREKWNKEQIYKRVLDKNKNNPIFFLHDGPPYANGSIHLGHSLNKILKDIIVRYKSINNFYTPYIPGWDTHGLPIENKILSEMNVNHKNISIVKLRKEAAKYALGQVQIQKEQFLKLQLLSDFKDIYVTLDKEFEVNQLKIFKKMCLDGLIYRGLKPVYWSPSSQSALAEAEVEYLEHRSPSIFVKFPIVKGNDTLSTSDNLIIWTTTPWTLIANAGIAVNKDFNYSLIKANGENYVIASQLVNQLTSIFGWEQFEIIKEFKGIDLVGIEYKSIINNDICPIVEGHHVTLDAGSGLVHIAPLFGEDDFIIGNKNNLNQIMHIEDDGTINENGKQFQGIFFEDANKNIGMWLDENKYLIKLQFIKHQYPHDWRTKKPIIFRGTPQWFVSISKIKDKIINEIKNIKFYSEWGYKRLYTMIDNRSDWTISRQRAWGVPIIIFYDENKNPIINEEIFDYVIDLVSQFGSDIWFERKCDELLPEKYRGKNWTKENDIMDVWFDSGTSFASISSKEGIKTPYDLYFEGSDQYRGWFNSSLINSVAFNEKSPFKALLSHGFVVDEKGKKMSKSLGNGIDPLDIINQSGADILRLWVANSEYSNDISISKNIISQSTEIYRKLRNTIRFILSNLYDYKHVKDIKLSGVNCLIMERLDNLKIKTKNNYDEYQFMNVVKNINNFVTDLSSFYLSVIKDILYVEKPDSQSRREVQYVLYEILDFLLLSLYPILPTTCEEAYLLFDKVNKKDSICLEEFYKIKDTESYEYEQKWKEFFDIKDDIYKLIENNIKSGLIKRSNEAFVTINSSNEFIKSLDMKTLLMVCDVKFADENKVEKNDSKKCNRCWNHFVFSEIKDDLCLRCYEIIKLV